MSERIRELAIKLDCIHEEIRVIESRIEPQDCGHLKTAVSVMKERAKEIKKEIYEWSD
jgi:hypothetical protein